MQAKFLHLHTCRYSKNFSGGKTPRDFEKLEEAYVPDSNFEISSVIIPVDSVFLVQEVNRDFSDKLTSIGMPSSKVVLKDGRDFIVVESPIEIATLIDPDHPCVTLKDEEEFSNLLFDAKEHIS